MKLEQKILRMKYPGTASHRMYLPFYIYLFTYLFRPLLLENIKNKRNANGKIIFEG